MGLIQVPRGIRTKRGYAPADIARSGAESVDPMFWESAFVMVPLFLGHPETAFKASYQRIGTGWTPSQQADGGRGFNKTGRGIKGSGQDSSDTSGWELLDTIIQPSTPKTFVYISVFSGNESYYFDVGLGQSVSGETNRLRLDSSRPRTEAAGGFKIFDKDIDDGEPHVLVKEIDGVNVTNARLWVDGLELGEAESSSQEYVDGSATVSVFDKYKGGFARPSTTQTGNFFGVFEGKIGEEIAARDVFDAYRRRPLLVPVSTSTGPSTPTNLQTTDITQTSARAEWSA